MNTLAAVVAQAGADEVTLTVGGAVIMTLSVALVVGLNVFCMSRILREQKPSEHHHVPLDIDTHDLDA
jgi:Na+-transporting NADH:ubiquinone oxidoreductase subunit NqrD